MKAKDVQKAILAGGWYKIKSKEHRQYKHPTKKGRITIPWHDNGDREINRATLAWVQDQAGLKL